MIDSNLVKQLKSRDAEERKQAIKALARLQDPTAIEFLSDVVGSDSDPEVSDLAFKAIAYIKKKTGYTEEESSMGSSYGDEGSEDTHEDEAIPLSQKVDVSQKDIDRAQSFVDQAMNMHTRGNNDKAADYLKKAFQTNPNLKYNSYTVGLAASVTELSGDEAVRRLTADQAKKGKPKSKSDGDSRDTMTWGDALIDLAIYGLVITGSAGAALFALFYLVIIPYISANPQITSSSGRAVNPLSAAQFITLMNIEGTKILVVMALVIGVISIIALFIQYVCIHIAASSILGGEGSLVGLIRKMTLFLTAVYAISIIISIVGFVFTITNPRNSGVVATFDIGFNLVVLVMFSQRVGSTYGFGGIKGCAAIVIGSILLVVAAIALLCLLPSSANAMQ